VTADDEMDPALHPDVDEKHALAFAHFVTVGVAIFLVTLIAYVGCAAVHHDAVSR
jgi:hypothetical protein